MHRRDFDCSFEVGDRPRDFQNAMVSARRKSEPLRRRLQKAARFPANLSVRVEPASADESVARHRWHFCEAVPLEISGVLHTPTNRARLISRAFSAQLAQCNRADVHMHIDAVGERTRDARAVPIDVRRRTIAGTGRIAGAPTRAWIRGANQRKSRRECYGLTGASDYDFGVFERLPQTFQHVTRKLQQLVEEQHAVVGETYLSRTRRRATTDQ